MASKMKKSVSPSAVKFISEPYNYFNRIPVEASGSLAQPDVVVQD